jgi:hypothetical protein
MMHALMRWMGMTMLILIGVAFILALVMLVLWQVRWIVSITRQISSGGEPRDS